MEAALHPWPALGALLLRDGLVSREQLEAVLADQRDSPHQRISGKRLGESLVEQGIVTETQIAQLVAEQYSLPFMELTESEVGIRAAVLAPEDLARRVQALPVSVLPDGSLLIAAADPPLALYSDELHATLGVPLRFAVTTAQAMDAAITWAFERARLLTPQEETLDLASVNGGGGHERDEVIIREADTTHERAAASAPVGLTRPWPVLGALLIRDDLVSAEELDAALAQQKVSGSRRLGEILVDRGAVSSADVARLVAEQYELPFVDLDASEVDIDVASRLDEELARSHLAVPVSVRDGEVVIALGDPTRILDTHALRNAFDLPVRFVGAVPDAVEAAVDLVHEARGGAVAPAPDELAAAMVPAPDEGAAVLPGDPLDGADATVESEVSQNTADEALQEDEDVQDDATVQADEASPDDENVQDDDAAQDDEAMQEDEAESLAPETIPGFEEPETAQAPRTPADLTALAPVARALDLGASHIHLDPTTDGLRVRVRVDGVVRTFERLGPIEGAALSTTLKDLASLDPEPRRTPTEAILSLPTEESGEEGGVVMRIAVVPTAAGEKLTLTVEGSGTAPSTLDDLGLTPTALEAVRLALARPSGAIVVSGPAGSGRTSTLYAAIREIAASERAIVTVEQPVEGLLDGVDQVEVTPSVGLTHTRALRALLRSDPDVVALSEVPDGELAAMALGAAGSRLVLAELEAPSAAAALGRLSALSTGTFDDVTSSIVLVVSQRLVRRICTECRETYYADADELAELGRPAEEAGRRLLGRGRGCASCTGSGYRGRIGVFEVLAVTPELRSLARSGASAEDLHRAAAAAGMGTLVDEVARLSLDGVTTAAEARRVFGAATPQLPATAG